MQQEKELSLSKAHNASTNPRSLHSKRSFGSRTAQHAVLDSPAAYDASEEDNDPLTDSGASVISVSDLPTSGRRTQGGIGLGVGGRNRQGGGGVGGAAARHALAREIVSSDEAVDSPTYDGDIESSTTAGPDPLSSSHHSNRQHFHPHAHHHPNLSTASVTSTLSPSSPHAPLIHSTTPTHNHVSNATGASAVRHGQNSSPPGLLRPTPSLPSRPMEPSPATQLPGSSTPLTFDPAKLTPEDIQAWFKEVCRSWSKLARRESYPLHADH
jgi:choline-phosphate cytidylyltransferase